jgi:glycosyltransferase involved in cell wall biosynthesis
MVLIEAMACGVPVISTKSGGPESIVTAGSEGFLTQVGHAVEMAARIEQLTKDLEINVEMGTRARKTVEQRFSTRAAASACMRLYQRIQRTGRV